MLGWLKRLAGDSNARALEALKPLVAQINVLEPQVQKLSQEEMRERTQAFRRLIASRTAATREAVAAKQAELDAETDPERRIVLRDEWKRMRARLFQEEQAILDEILPEAFALVREAAVRTIGQRHFDEQLMGGIVLHQGKIAEMKTGEGKTLTATLPLYLNALVGRGVHLVTVNDYLARRDCGWMGQIFHYLGLSTGVIIPDFSGLYDPSYTDENVLGHDERLMHLRPVPRRKAYQADITYGTNNEFGFDYLRDNMAYSLDEIVQRELYFAIVDEVDNILIDEARTPLIISAPDVESYQQYLRFARIAHSLGPGDYEVDEKEQVVTLTEQGVDRVERALGIRRDLGESLYDENHAELTFFLDAALKARLLYEKDKDYVIKDKEVVIVDEFTGRLMPGRRWSDGIHESIEAKERVIYGEPVEVQRESKTFATITFQNYFRLYQKLAGMTGTAATEREEFFKIYGLDVVVIPTHRPMIRVDYPDRIYAREEGKFRAVVQEIVEKHKRGQPVLVGTTSVERSEYLSRLLQREGIPHEVLNAKHHEREALIVARAGQKGAVTIATNMAGRGTDIVLGPGVVREECIDPETRLSRCCIGCSDDCSRCFKPRKFASCVDDVPCGLHIIGTERHEARRIDNQLRGRSGRQGDPGSSRFYLSTEDELMRRFGPGADRVRAVLERFNPGDDAPLEARVISRMIEQAQVRVEGYHFDIRKHLVEFDDVLNRQREVIYAERRRVLSARDVHGVVLARLREEITARVEEAFAGLSSRKEYERDPEAVREALEGLLEGIQNGRVGREELTMPLFPVISQSLAEEMQKAISELPEDQQEEALGTRLSELHEAALAHFRERSVERVARIVARALYEEEHDAEGFYLTHLYRTLTRDLRIPLPATTTAARWARMEPEAIEEEVLTVVEREADDEVRRLRPKLQGQVSSVVQAWKSRQRAWWTVVDYLTELDRSLRLPPRSAAEQLVGLRKEAVIEELYRLGVAYLQGREQRLGPELMREIERGYLLRAIDREWVDYLTAMEDLRQGIGLRAYGQQDPLVEYRRESYHLFQRLLARVRAQALFYIFRASEAPLLRRIAVPSGERRPVRVPKEAKKPAGVRPQPVAAGATPSASAASGTRKKRKRRKR
ncbi:MAG: preprotein translocase subunit SecA [Chloroflexia bacterium]